MGFAGSPRGCSTSLSNLPALRFENHTGRNLSRKPAVQFGIEAKLYPSSPVRRYPDGQGATPAGSESPLALTGRRAARQKGMLYWAASRVSGSA